jgi:hypothetical protein
MALPGTTVTVRDTAPPRSAPTAADAWFVAGLTEKGPLTPNMVGSLDAFRALYGARQTYSILSDAVEAFFREGGTRLFVARVVGPAAVVATVNLPGTTGTTMTARALGPGDYGNALSVVIAVGGTPGTYVVTVKSGGTTVEVSPELVDEQAGIDWSQASSYIRLTKAGGTGDPTAGTYALATGTDDRASILDAAWTAALDMFSADLGPGQVSMPGRTTAAAHAAILAHAAKTNRIGLLDAPDTPTVATLVAAATAARGTTNGRYGALLAPWGIAPGVIASTTRTIPPSAVMAALIATADRVGTPNQPAAGRNGQSSYLVGLTQTYSDADRGTLNDGGVDVMRTVYGGVRAYGYRTLADPTTEAAWLELSNARLFMAIRAEGAAIAESFVFAEIDGRGRTFSQLAGALVGMLVPYFEAGSLYGTTPAEAFAVDVGAQVNTPATIAARELRAVISLRVSHFAEVVALQIAKVPTTESLS